MRYRGPNNHDVFPKIRKRLLKIAKGLGVTSVLSRPNSITTGQSESPQYYRSICDFGNFDAPANQMLAEIEQIEKFNNIYPGSREQWTLSRMLEALNDISGVTSDLNSQNSHIEDLEFESSIGVSDVSAAKRSSKIQLLYPVLEFRRGPNVTDKDAEDDYRLVQSLQKGHVLGAAPAHVNDAFKAIFYIIGAKKIKDDRYDQKPIGDIVWQGSYNGVTVYVDIYYYVSYSTGTESYFCAEMLNNELGKELF